MKQHRVRAAGLVATLLLLAACSATSGQPGAEQAPQMAAPAASAAPDPGRGPAADPDAGQGAVDPSSPVDPQPGVGTSIPLIGSSDRSLRGVKDNGPPDKKPAREMLSPPERPSSGPDAAIQTVQAQVAPPTPAAPFEGMSLNPNGAGWPPDTTGDVGPSHVIQAVNTSVAIYDKATGTAVAGPMTFNTFFSGAGTGTPCDSTNQGDPVVLYDSVSGRWIVTDFAWSNLNRGPWYECIAVSKSADPVNGGWWFYGFKASTTAMNDYPKFGVWGNGIWMTANMFKGARTYSNAQVWALNRDDMIAGKAIRTVTWNMGSSNFSLLPGNIDGDAVKSGDAAATASGPQYALSSYGSTTSLSLWKLTVDWTTVTGNTPAKVSIPVASYVKTSGRIAQKGSTETLDTLGDRLMYPLQYRNGSLWAAQSVAPSSGHAGVRWWQIGNLGNTTPSVLQQATWAPDTSLERWMPALAVNTKGEMAVIYSASSSAAYPSIRFSGRTATAAASTLDISETVLQAGAGSQSGGYNRWGDYAMASVDPVDNCTFWYSTEYYASTGNDWHTKFGSFRLTSCP